MMKINFNRILNGVAAFLATSLFAVVSPASSADVVFTQITQGDFDEISKELSANFTHTSVSGASSLGTLFGFQLGVVGGVTKTPNINSFAQRNASSTSVNQIPHGGLIGQVSIPAGVTFEALFLPSVGSNDFKVKNTSLGVKWTLTSLLVDLPVDLAVKGMYSTSSLNTTQTLNGGNQSISFEDKMLGFGLMVSKTFGVVEPYFGLIQNRANVNMDVTGTGTVFSTSFTGSQNASTTVTSTGYVLGAELKLLFFNAGAEVTHIFGATRYTAKLAFSF